jgi:Phage integrase family
VNVFENLVRTSRASCTTLPSRTSTCLSFGEAIAPSRAPVSRVNAIIARLRSSISVTIGPISWPGRACSCRNHDDERAARRRIHAANAHLPLLRHRMRCGRDDGLRADPLFRERDHEFQSADRSSDRRQPRNAVDAPARFASNDGLRQSHTGHPFEVANPFLWRTKAELVRLARSVIETRRGQHSTHVFAYNGKPVLRMLNSAWKKARARTALPRLRVHDPKHTFGRRLRAAGVSFEDRQDLLGHRSARITTHYSPAELSGLIEAAERVSEQNGARPELVVLRGKLRTTPAKLPQAMRLASVQAFEIIGAG